MNHSIDIDFEIVLAGPRLWKGLARLGNFSPILLGDYDGKLTGQLQGVTSSHSLVD